ncbi:MAG: bacillithiol biosynthesis cysteine-adding enzyme BshC [Candidatus Kapabacteria bacterium]|nr:bacillithiol biosynthesis cysteine-adding enzyme BshC [Candidatus Kapabacteria bacterium]
MYKSIPLNEMPGSTKLFQDFMKNVQPYCIDSVSSKIEEILSHNFNRVVLADSIRQTAAKLELNETQLGNISLLEQKQTLAVVSGQQAGFLGGSIYTLLKALDTVRIAKELKQKNPDYDFVPIFWIEDNDNDLDEASKTCLFDSNYNAIEFRLPYHEHKTVADTLIDDSAFSVIETAGLMFSKYQFCTQICEIIDKAYKNDNSWSEAFTILLQKIIGDTGVLFLSAEKLVKTGIFKDIVRDEITNLGRTYRSVEKKNAELVESGYHIQAQVSEFNLFYHSEGYRYKIDKQSGEFVVNDKKFSHFKMDRLIESNPENFSPKVLLRPIFQDFAIPTAVYIGGPGEIAYHSQIDYLYQDFGITKPSLMMRTSVTLIDKKNSRYLSKIDKPPEYFWKHYQEIEKEIAVTFLNEEHDKIFGEFRMNLANQFKSLEDYLINVDNQLERTVMGAYVKITEQIDQLDKKTLSSAKRLNEDTLQKFRTLSNAIFPLDTLQERVISPLFFLSQSENLITQLLDLNDDSKAKHIFLEI